MKENQAWETLNPLTESEEELVLQNLMGQSSHVVDQPDLNPDFFDFTENDDQSMYHPDPPMVQLNTLVYENAETRSPLTNSEEQVNLSGIKEEENLNCLNANPLFVLSIIPWIGSFNFRVTIPPPDSRGVKPKWCFSERLNKLYVARNVAFPVNIMLDSYPMGAVLNVCPVFTESSNRMIPVTRCPNCQITDKEMESRDHVIKVESSSAYYFYENDRHMVSIPLGLPAPGDNMLNAFLKVACRTSCSGGPNRKLFSILLTLKLGESEIGRQVINVKCCEGPLRDMGTDEKRENMTPETDNKEDMKKVFEVANGVANIKKTKATKKRKLPDVKVAGFSNNSLEWETISAPKIYIRKAKKYINALYARDQVKKMKENNMKFLSGGDIKSIFTTDYSE